MLVAVAVPVPFLPLLTYRVPDGFEPPARGARVLVPVGLRQLTGCVVGPADAASPADPDAIKTLTDVLDDEALLPEAVIDLALWVAEYYMAGPGEALAAAMPPLSTVASERRVVLTAAGRRALDAGAGDRSVRGRVLEALAEGRPLTVAAVAARVPGIAVHSAVRSLARDGLLEVQSRLTGRAAAFRTVPVASITVHGLAALAPEAGVLRGTRQREALEALAGAPAGIPLADLRDRGLAGDIVRRLASRGLASIREEPRERDPFASGAAAFAGVAIDEGLAATDEQRVALERLTAMADAGGYHAALLHGVTGSGKTEVYRRLAVHVVASGRRVLLLVPEIALTPAVAAVFRATFGARVAVQHSGLSAGERHDQWHRIRRGEVDVVVGTRSAVFAPLARLGLVIVDEEHDTSYKQEETPRYHGRDVAVMRARREGALVVLGSATPSIESYRNAEVGRYERLTLERRVMDRALAAVRIVDMRAEMAERGGDVVLSEALCDALAARLARREQALLLLNRRGYATAVFCRQCGDTLPCPNCSVSLIVHRRRAGEPRARCHYCNYGIAVPKACLTCAEPYLEQVGFGTQRVEEEVRRLFPEARVGRIDRDTMQRRGDLTRLLEAFRGGELDVLVGTQMIAKGHDFPRVTLVGAISADVGLGVADFRAAERTFQLLTQVAGRAGRGEAPGEAVIQTLFPEHYSIRRACAQDYAGFYAEELRYRTAMHYPPAVALVNVVVRGRTFSEAMHDAATLAGAVSRQSPGTFALLGPAPAPLGRLRGEYRAQFFMKGRSRGAMRRALAAPLDAQPALRRRVGVDVDPVGLL